MVNTLIPTCKHTIVILHSTDMLLFNLHIFCPFPSPISQFLPPMSHKPTCQVYSNIVFSIAYPPRALTCLTVTLNPGPDSPRCRSSQLNLQANLNISNLFHPSHSLPHPDEMEGTKRVHKVQH